MQEKVLMTAIAMTLTIAACNRAPADEARRADASPAVTAPAPSAPAPSVPSSSGATPAPSTVGTTPAPSDARDPAFKAAETTKAGSAIGGTQGGNVTDPQGTVPKGGPIGSKVPEATGGDGTPQGDKDAPKSK
jgi:hypothetical protein